jgi:2-phosphoglycerate kinase
MADLMPEGRQQNMKRWTAEAIDAMRRGAATYDEWSWLQSTTNIMKSVNQCTDLRGMTDHLQQVQTALVSIFERATNGASPYIIDTPAHWTPVTLYPTELDAIYLLNTLHNTAFKVISARQWNLAIQKAKGRALTKRAFIRVPEGEHHGKR